MAATLARVARQIDRQWLVAAMKHDARLDALVADLVAWVAREPRPYAEVMEAWRTSCPRLSVWEEAVDRGLLIRQAMPQGGVCVAATDAGRRFLEKRQALVSG